MPQQSQCGAHHLKFAQQRSLARKARDEFIVPDTVIEFTGSAMSELAIVIVAGLNCIFN